MPLLSTTPSMPIQRQDLDLVSALRRNIESVILGKGEVVKLAVTALLARGHVLIEDIPGIGKTALARATARSIACGFRRIQFTPDLLPSDVTGVSVFDPDRKDFTFKRGPIFANVVLADEINRATPRTQSALLEAMGENKVSVDGATQPLPERQDPARRREPARGDPPCPGLPRPCARRGPRLRGSRRHQGRRPERPFPPRDRAADAGVPGRPHLRRPDHPQGPPGSPGPA